MIRKNTPSQLELFAHPFDKKLDTQNRWVLLADKFPWEELSKFYIEKMSVDMGSPGKESRMVLGAVIIKHICNLTDVETITNIQENVYMQYFVGLPGFQTDVIFDPSLFVTIRKRLDPEFWKQVNNLLIAKAEQKIEEDRQDDKKKDSDSASPDGTENDGELLMDATTAEQDITYPNDLGLLNQSREKLEYLIAKAVWKTGNKMPRTYKIVARKDYLNTAKKKNKSRKTIRKAISKQLGYVSRDLKHMQKLLKDIDLKGIFKEREIQYLQDIQKVYDQQKYMYTEKTHSVKDRIVSIHQPHVRPMVRGKAGSDVEFGSKLGVSVINGFTRLETLDWNNYNEGSDLIKSAENYQIIYGYFPKKIIADQKYITRDNRAWCKERNIHLSGKPLGRPTPQTDQALRELRYDSAKRNAVEGKFGQAKRKYGMDCIKAKLKNTSESWIGAIVFVLNIVRWEQISGSFLNLIRYLLYWIKMTRNFFFKPVFQNGLFQ